MPRFQVILTQEESERFAAYCESTGHKKSTLAAWLIREHLDAQGFAPQPNFLAPRPKGAPHASRPARPGQ